MCLYSKTILNRKYIKNKSNGGQVPPVPDERMKWIQADCGNCIECRKAKAREWQQRLLEDIKLHKNGKFITLTFSNESIKELNEEYIQKTDVEGKKVKIPIKELYGYEKDNAIATRALRLFNERWRKKHKTALRHWIVTELGHNGTENIHMHGIIWTNESIKEIKNVWKYGFIWPREDKDINTNYVNGATVNYIVKYVSKMDLKHKKYKSKILASAGIGSNYQGKENTYKGKDTNKTYRTSTGHKIAMPAYWKKKIYTDVERERLWLDSMNEQIMWVMGEKIDIKNGTEEYEELKKYYQKINEQQGYGTDNRDEKLKKEEEERRYIMQSRRIQNTKRRATPE